MLFEETETVELKIWDFKTLTQTETKKIPKTRTETKTENHFFFATNAKKYAFQHSFAFFFSHFLQKIAE